MQDLRANGLFAISKINYDTCYDLTLKITCPGQTRQSTYDITDPSWPVGDHGYNPTTGTGFNSLIPDKTSYVNAEEARDPVAFQRLLYEVAKRYPTCIQPCTPKLKLIELLQVSNAADMANEFYGRAQTAWRQNRFVDAMYNLGIALHLVQDATVPFHTQLVGDNPPNTPHSNYEKHVWEVILGKGQNKYSVTGDYSYLDAKNWLKSNASKSIQFSLDFNSSYDCVQLGIKSTIGFLYSFFRSVGYIGDTAWLQSLLLSDDNISLGSPDLIVSAVTRGPYYYGYPLEYTITFKNIGSGIAYLEGPTDSIYDNAGLQTYLSKDSNYPNGGEIAAGGTLLAYYDPSALVLKKDQTFSRNWYYSNNFDPNIYKYLIVEIINYPADGNASNNVFIVPVNTLLP